MEKDKIIELTNISKSFDGTFAVEDFNLYVKKGEFITFLGPSGCGKTTTLRMIAGFEIPTTGQILLNGKDITKLPPYERPVNTVFQRYALFPHMDVYDNIAFGLKLKRLPVEVTDKAGNKKIKYKKLTHKEIDEKVKKALKIVDLEEFEFRNIATLSGGQQQRIAIARAIVNEPQILLLDEPLGALDLKMRKEMQEELKLMHKKLGITFIYVTHDQEEALTMSDTIVVMKDGMIQQIGTPEQIYNEPANAFVADFIGESNIYSGTMVGAKQVRFLNATFPCVDDFPINEKVDVVIRPEDVIFKEDGRVKGVITLKTFKGTYYEYILMVGKNEVVVQTTESLNEGETKAFDITPFNIHIMAKEFTVNRYTDAWIDRLNRVVISDAPFECDVTQLIPNSHLDDEGYLVDQDGTRYDLTDADVIAEVDLNKIEITDNLDEGSIIGEIISFIYKGDHYQVIVRTEEEEDFVLDTEYTWNEHDKVGVKIAPKDIRLKLKKEVKEYVKA